MLFDHGIDVNIQNKYGYTYGADMFILDNHKYAPIDVIGVRVLYEQLFANALGRQRMNKNNNMYSQSVTETSSLLTHETSNMCDICGKTSKVDVDRLFNCIGCHSRTYCSKKCQKFDWKQNNHKYDS